MIIVFYRVLEAFSHDGGHISSKLSLKQLFNIFVLQIAEAEEKNAVEKKGPTTQALCSAPF